MTTEVFPLSFKEFLDFKDIHVESTTSGRGRLEASLQEYLKFGGFPEVALLEEEVDKVIVLRLLQGDTWSRCGRAIKGRRLSGEVVWPLCTRIPVLQR